MDEGDPWNPKEEVVQRVHRVCAEVSRVLKPGGVYLQVSFAVITYSDCDLCICSMLMFSRLTDAHA